MDRINKSAVGAPARFLFGDDVTDTGAPEEQNPGLLRDMFTRPFAQIPLTASDMAGGPKYMDTKGPAQSVLFGNKPLESYIEQAETGGVDFLTETAGFSPEDAQKAVPFMAAAGVLTDITPVGLDDAGKKVLPKVLSNVDEIGDLVRYRADDVLDYLPKYRDELEEMLTQAQTMFKNNDFLRKTDPQIPDKKVLQTTITEIQTALGKVDSEIERLLLGVKNTATDFLSTSKGIVEPNVNITSTGQIDEINSLLNKPDTVVPDNLSLPAPSALSLGRPSSVTFTQAQSLLKKGDALQDITEVVVKNANEARQAFAAGIPAEKITIGQNSLRQGKTLFGTPTGDIITDLPANQKAFDFAQDAKGATLDTGNRFTQFVRNMFLDTPDNLKKTFGKLYDTHLAPTITRHTERMGDAAEWANTYYDKLGQLNITPGSVDDKLIRAFQKKDGFRRVAAEVSQEKALQLQNAYQSLRLAYDEIIDFVNVQRKSMNLNAIPKKADFLSQIGSKGKSILDATIEGGVQQADEISSAIFKKQEGQATTGAIESMIDYLEYAKRAGFTDLTGKELNDFRLALSENADAPRAALEQLRKIEENILGNKAINPAMQTVDNILGKMRSSKVLGKASTLLNQALSFPQGIMAAGPINFTRGVLSDEAIAAAKNSNFLKAVRARVPKSLRGSGVGKKVVGTMGDVLADAQNFTSQKIWQGFYTQARRAGLKGEEAITWADEMIPKIVGDRRLGMGPEVYNTFIGRTLGAFTIEPTAAMTRLVTSLGKKRFAEVAGTLVAWHVFNQANERFGTGYSPFIDPYQAVKDSLEYATGSDKKEQSNLKAATRLISEALQGVPMINNAFNTAYSVGESAGILPDSREVFGSDDNTWMNTASLYNPLQNATRPITGSPIVDVPLNISGSFIPGVEQLLRTTQAGQSLDRGYAETRAGDPMYKMPENPVDQVRALLFGQSATPEAKDWFDDDFAGWLSDSQQKILDKIPDKESALDFLGNTQDRNRKVNQLQSQREGLKAGTSELFASDAPKTAGGQSVDSLFEKPTSKAEESESRSMLFELMASGAVPSDKDIQNVLFGGKSASTKKISERRDVYQQLGTLMEDEYLTDAQKQQIIKASGATPKQVEFYSYARMTNDEKIEELLPTLGDLSTPEGMTALLVQRAKIAGAQGLTPGMIDYLYENDYISKDQQALLKAVDYDEVGQKFFIKKGSKFGSGGGSGGSKKMTFSQIFKLFSIDFDSINKMKSDSHYQAPKDPGLIENILNSRV